MKQGKYEGRVTEITAEISFIYIIFYDALSTAQFKKFRLQRALQMGNEEGQCNTNPIHLVTAPIRFYTKREKHGVSV
jgi:hypothetical protein